MKKVTFNISISAPREKVWKTLWEDKTYREWTAVFAEGCHAQSDWKEGSKIRFLNGKGEGMYSLIETKIGQTQMTFKHLGEIKEGKETPSNWGDARESYFLSGNNDKTDLKVELDTLPDWEAYFNETFPKALNKLKEVAERN